MTRRVVQWSATNYDREELQVVTVFEEGISKQDVKSQVPFSRWHRVLYKTGGGNGYDFK